MAWVRVTVVNVVKVFKNPACILKVEPAGFVDSLHVYETEESRITASVWLEQLEEWTCG